MLMKCICTSITRMGLPPRRKTWLSKLVKKRKERPKSKLRKNPQVMIILIKNIALMVRKTTKMLKKLNRQGVKFDSRKKKFFSSNRKPISKMDCYNYGELGHLSHQCNKPKKNKFKGKKYDESDDEKKGKKFFKKKEGKHKRFHKNKNGKAYIVGDWLTDIECIFLINAYSSEEEDDEKVTTITTDFSSPPSSPSSTTHLCLMAKGERKVQNENVIVEDCDSDSDDEYASPTYDELADLLKEYTQIIRNSKAKCDKLKDENELLTTKYGIVIKATEEMKEENKTMSSTKNELKTSLKDAKEKCEKNK
jgi:hypothetical protein